jgi:hypothetical protein
MSTHNAQALLIQGWFTELEIPCLNSDLEASNALYNITKHDLEHLGILAASMGFPVAEGRYLLQVWVVAPLPGLVGSGRAFRDVFFMVLLPNSEVDTFERLEVVQVKLRDAGMEDLDLCSPREIAERLNWRRRKFRLV